MGRRYLHGHRSLMAVQAQQRGVAGGQVTSWGIETRALAGARRQRRWPLLQVRLVCHAALRARRRKLLLIIHALRAPASFCRHRMEHGQQAAFLRRIFHIAMWRPTVAFLPGQ